MNGIKMLSALAKMKEKKEIEEIKKAFYKKQEENNIKKDEEFHKIIKKTRYKIYSPDKKNNNNLIKEIEIDNELINLWDSLGVTLEFRKKFNFKLNYFSNEYQKIILDCEKYKMKKIYDLIIKITNESIDKDKLILNLKRLNIVLQNERNYNIENDRNLFEAKNTLNNLKNHLINIFQQVSDLRNLISYDYINNKFDLSKMLNSYILDSQFLIKINNDLKIIKENYIGLIFGIKSPFDPLLMNFLDKKDNKKNFEAYYILFNELIFNNYNPEKKIGKKVIIKRTNINNKNNLQINVLNKNHNFSYSRDDNDDIKNNILNSFEDNKIDFVKNDIFELENEYKNYYLNIPKEQKVIFNIKDNLNDYINKINPMFIIKKQEGNLNLFCSLCNSKDENNTIEITNFSVLNNENIKNEIEDIIKLLNEKQINYENLTINLYYEKIENKLILNKDINNIFKQLNFKWSKLENLEGGIRYQKMKYINENFISKNNNNNAFNIISGLIIYNGKDNMEKIIKSKDFDFNFNQFNLYILENEFLDNDEILNKISSQLRNGMNYNKTTDLNEINKIFEDKKIKLKLPSNLNNKILYNIFQINTQFESYFQVEIKGKKFIRITQKIEVLIEKQTDQKFYMLVMKDGNILIISEINNKFNKILKNENNNIYNIFNDIYQRIEPIEEKILSIYIPILNNEIIYKSNTIPNYSCIENIKQVYNIVNIFSNENNNNFISNILPKENDIILNNNLFISIINIDIANELDYPSIICFCLNQ